MFKEEILTTSCINLPHLSLPSKHMCSTAAASRLVTEPLTLADLTRFCVVVAVKLLKVSFKDDLFSNSCWEKVRRQKKGFRALWLILAFEIKYGLAAAWGPSLTWWVPARQMKTDTYFIPIVLVSDVRERKSIQRGEAGSGTFLMLLFNFVIPGITVISDFQSQCVQEEVGLWIRRYWNYWHLQAPVHTHAAKWLFNLLCLGSWRGLCGCGEINMDSAVQHVPIKSPNYTSKPVFLRRVKYSPSF